MIMVKRQNCKFNVLSKVFEKITKFIFYHHPVLQNTSSANAVKVVPLLILTSLPVGIW